MQRFVREVPTAPKPAERAMYVLGVSLFSLLMVAFAWLGDRLSSTGCPKVGPRLAMVLHLLAYWCAVPLVIGKAASLMFLHDEYVHSNTFVQHPLLGAGITLAILLAIKPIDRFCSTRPGRLLPWIAYAASMLLTIPAFVFADSSITYETRFALHLNAYISSVIDVLLGMTMSVDYVSQYGLYAHFLEPIFRIFPLSVLSFTITMTALIALTLYLLFKYLLESTESFTMAFLGYASILLYTYFVIRIDASIVDPYYQVFPHRHLFPCIIIYLAWRYFKSRGRAAYHLAMAVASAAILWNPDTGIMTALAWLATLFLVELSQGFSRADLVRAVAHIPRFVLAFTAVASAYSLLIRATHGAYPDFRTIQAYLGDIGKAGFTFIPMPLIDPWNGLLLIYAAAVAGFLLGRDHRLSPVWQSRLFVAFLGFGLFTYYEGRSHHYNLISISFPGVVLLASLASDLWRDIQARRFSKAPAFLMLLFLLASSPVTLLSGKSIAHFSDLWSRLAHAPASSPILENAKFIAAHSMRGEKVLILSGLNWFYHMHTGIPRPLKLPNFAEMLYARDRQVVEDAISSRKLNIIFADSVFLSDNAWAEDRLGDGYRFSESSHGLSMAVPEPADIVPAVGIRQKHLPPDILREYAGQGGLFFYDAARGKRVKWQDEPISLGSSFAIEAVVIPDQTQRRYACLLSNHPGKQNFQGFAIQQEEGNANVYSFGYGDGQKWLPSIKFSLRADALNYVAITNNEGLLSVYVNGTKAAEVNAGGSMANSELRLSLGNWENKDRPFHGSIKQIRILARSLADQEIADHWESAKRDSRP